MTPEYKQSLRNRLSMTRDEWAHDRGQGCPTCGYGGGIEIDYDRLIAEIDAFAADFARKHPSEGKP